MSRLKVLSLVMVVLAVVAVTVNARFLRKWLRGETRAQAEVARRFQKPVPLDPAGSEEAKVKLTAFVESANECHSNTVEWTRFVANAVPKRVRVDFVDTLTPEGGAALAKAGIDCESGILINGKDTYEGEQGGGRVSIPLHGPLGMEIPPPVFLDAVEQEIARQYDDGLTEEESAAMAALREKAAGFFGALEGMPPHDPGSDSDETAGDKAGAADKDEPGEATTGGEGPPAAAGGAPGHASR